jgi:hypothetical protein
VHAAVEDGELERDEEVVLFALGLSGEDAAGLREDAGGVGVDGGVVVHLLDEFGALCVGVVVGEESVEEAQLSVLEGLAQQEVHLFLGLLGGAHADLGGGVVESAAAGALLAGDFDMGDAGLGDVARVVGCLEAEVGLDGEDDGQVAEERVLAQFADVAQEEVALVAPALEGGGVEGDDLRGAGSAGADGFWGAAAAAAGGGAVSARDAGYRRANANWLGDLCAVVQHGPARDTFHWRGPGGMLARLGDLLRVKYGATAPSEHLALLEAIAAEGHAGHWALLWVLFLAVDAGLQSFVVSADVRRYVGRDGEAKWPVAAGALAAYVRALRAALRRFAMGGLAEGWRVRRAVLDWPVFGGRAHHGVAVVHEH